MYHTIDTALTYAAEFVLFGSLIYLPIAFLVYAWQAETKKSKSANHDRLAATQAQLKQTQDKLAEVNEQLALIDKVLPLLQQEKAALEAQIATGMVEPTGDDDAIAPSGVPSPEVSNNVMAAALEVANDGDDDAGAAPSTEVPANVPLPIVARASLTLWKRRGEQVVKTECIPVALPDNIKRFRWRKAEVIRLADLTTIAQIV